MEHKILILASDNYPYEVKDFLTKRDNTDFEAIGVILQTKVIGVIISLEQWRAVWSHEPYTIINKEFSGASVLQTFKGLDLTRNIVRQNNEEMTAALRCWNYKKGGLQWYLPSLYELSTIITYRDELNEVFETLGAEPLSKNSFIWSSSEFDRIFAYCLVVNTGAFNISEKAGSAWVRAVSECSPLRSSCLSEDHILVRTDKDIIERIC